MRFSQLRRREFITFLGVAAVGRPRVARAQQRAMPRIGVFSGFPDDPGRSYFQAFKEGLEVLGWVDGRTARIDYRIAIGDAGRVRTLAAEMIGTRPDVILTMTPPALVALRQETGTIPVVFANVSDPVDGGFVESMARPSGNVTGFTSFEYSLSGKWLQLLKEAMPSLARVLVLINPVNYTSRALLRTVETAALSARVRVVPAAVGNIAEIEAAIITFTQESNGGIIVLPDPLTTIGLQRIVELAMTHRVPTIHQNREFAVIGGLMTYGPDFLDIYRRAASYVDRILKGAKDSRAPRWATCRYRIRPNMSLSSTSRQPKRSASRYRLR